MPPTRIRTRPRCCGPPTATGLSPGWAWPSRGLNLTLLTDDVPGALARAVGAGAEKVTDVPPGPDGLRPIIAGMRTGFPDLHYNALTELPAGREFHSEVWQIPY
jgi:hypothetical protein